jgi:hypothetical protein
MITSIPLSNSDGLLKPTSDLPDLFSIAYYRAWKNSIKNVAGLGVETVFVSYNLARHARNKAEQVLGDVLSAVNQTRKSITIAESGLEKIATDIGAKAIKLLSQE